MWSTAMFKPGAETGAGNSFYSNVQEKWTAKVLKHLSHGHASLLPNPQPRQLYACFFFKRRNICCRWMHLRGQFSKECQIYGSGWVGVISPSRLWQFVTVDGIKSSCLIVVLGSHRDQCRVQYYCAYFFFNNLPRLYTMTWASCFTWSIKSLAKNEKSSSILHEGYQETTSSIGFRNSTVKEFRYPGVTLWPKLTN